MLDEIEPERVSVELYLGLFTVCGTCQAMPQWKQEPSAGSTFLWSEWTTANSDIIVLVYHGWVNRLKRPHWSVCVDKMLKGCPT